VQTFLPYPDFLASAAALDARRLGKQRVEAGEVPPWLGDPDLHRSHRSSLPRKDPEHYREAFTGVPVDVPYVWPVSDRPGRFTEDPAAGRGVSRAGTPVAGRLTRPAGGSRS
jgi:hypothetical protein